MKTKINLISGFLGSGKTTLLREILERYDGSKEIAIIENEFGEIGIDGDILKTDNLNVREIRSGCICCSLTGEFSTAISELVRDYSPDEIFIEPSGVSLTSEIINSCLNLRDTVEINNVINIINSKKHMVYKRNFREFYNDQVNSANINILNRLDGLSKEDMDILVNDIKETNSYSQIVMEDDLDIMNIVNYKSIKSLEDYVKTLVPTNHNHNDDNRLEEICFITNDFFTKEQILEKLNDLKDSEKHGDIIRGKGFLRLSEKQSIMMDYVSGEINLKEIDIEGPGRICFIGEGLSKIRIKELFQIKELI